MSFHDREEKILKILYDKDVVKNSELAKQLYVSPSTLRRDLDVLEQKGTIIRSHGDCRLSKRMREERSLYSLREQQQSSAKKIVAKKAIKLIEDGNTIMMDASTSAYNMIHMLDEFKDLLVITNNAKASFMLGTMDISNISTGGKMVKKTFAFVGQDAINNIRNYNADILFFSCRGISEEGFLTDTAVEENMIRREMMKRSKKKVLLINKEKIGKSYLHNLCHLSEIDEIICEEQLPEYILNYMKNKG